MSDTSLIFNLLAVDRASEKILGVKSAFGLLAIGVAASAATFTEKSIHMAADFEASQLRLVTTAGESEKNLKMVGDGVLDMAGKVGVGAAEMSTALYTVESAGYHGAASLKVLEAASKGAKIEGANVKEVADAVSSALNDYHMPAEKAAEATNTLIAAVGRGKTTMQALSGAMPNVMAAAAAAGVSFQEAASAMATMTMHGTDATVAGTYLRQVILGLENPTAKAKLVMRGLGLDANTVSMNLGKNGLASTIEMLENAIKNHLSPSGLVAVDSLKKVSGSTTQFQQVLANLPPTMQTQIGALANMVGGVKNLQGFLQLGGENLHVFKENTAAVTEQVKHGGKEIDGWSKYQETYNYKLDSAKASLGALTIQIGTALLPKAKEMIDATMTAVTWFTKHKDITVTLGTVIGTLAGVMLLYKTYVWGAAAATKIAAAAVDIWKVAVKGAEIATKVWTASQWALNVAMDANPVGVLILAIALIAGGIWLLWTHSSGFRKFFIEMWADIWGWMKSVGAWFAGPFADFFVHTWDSIVGGVKDMGHAIHGAWDSVIDFFTSLPGKIGAVLEKIPGQLADLAMRGIHGMYYAFGYGIGLIIKEWNAFPGQVWRIVTWLWDTAKDLMKKGIDGTVDFFVKLPGRVETEVRRLWNAVTKLFDDGNKWTVETMAHMWTSLSTNFLRGVDTVIGWVQKLPGQVAHWFGETYRHATSWASRTVDDTISFFYRLPGRAWDALKGLGPAVLRATSGAGKWLYNVGHDIITGLVDGIRGAWGWAVDVVKSFMHDILQGARDAIASHSPSRRFADEVGKWIPYGVAAGVGEHAGVALNAVTGLMDSLVTDGPARSGVASPGSSGGGVALPGGGNGRPGGSQGGTLVEMRAAPGDQVAEFLLSLLRPTVRGRYGGDVSVAMGGAS